MISQTTGYYFPIQFVFDTRGAHNYTVATVTYSGLSHLISLVLSMEYRSCHPVYHNVYLDLCEMWCYVAAQDGSLQLIYS